jgi:hypothetical protein
MVARTSTPEPSHNDVRMAQVQQDVVTAAEQSPGDYSLFGHLMHLSLELAANGEFDQALWVADEMIAVAQGRFRLRPRRVGRYRGLGKRVVSLAREAKEQIVEIRRETETNR